MKGGKDMFVDKKKAEVAAMEKLLGYPNVQVVKALERLSAEELRALRGEVVLYKDQEVQAALRRRKVVKGR